MRPPSNKLDSRLSVMCKNIGLEWLGSIPSPSKQAESDAPNPLAGIEAWRESRAV